MVTPMSPGSAIADVMMQAVPRMGEQLEIDVWCPQVLDYRPCPVPVTSYLRADDETLLALRAYDLVIYVLGNSPGALADPSARTRTPRVGGAPRRSND